MLSFTPEVILIILIFAMKVKKTGVAPNLPEERQRYWNAYMLFYESRVEKKSTKTTR